MRFLDRNTPPHIATLILIAGISALEMIDLPAQLPRMTEYFETDYATMQLALSRYLAASAVLQIFIGPISDSYGRRPVLMGDGGVCAGQFGLPILPPAWVFLASACAGRGGHGHGAEPRGGARHGYRRHRPHR